MRSRQASPRRPACRPPSRDSRTARRRVIVRALAVQSPEREAHGVDVFVGRERELAILDAALAAASEARGGVVLFAGEPGIGKTRLIDEFARAARSAGATVVVGRCYEGDG